VLHHGWPTQIGLWVAFRKVNFFFGKKNKLDHIALEEIWRDGKGKDDKVDKERSASQKATSSSRALLVSNELEVKTFEPVNRLKEDDLPTMEEVRVVVMIRRNIRSEF
jgi:hypothetical protein